MRKNTFLMVLGMIFMLSCEEDKPTQVCRDDLACTEIFVSLLVEIRQNGEPVNLDHFKTIHVDSGEIYELSDEHIMQDGVYPVLTDAQFEDVEKNGTNFRFEGSIQDAVVVDELYKIGHDCCHIVLLEGPEIIDID